MGFFSTFIFFIHFLIFLIHLSQDVRSATLGEQIVNDVPQHLTGPGMAQQGHHHVAAQEVRRRCQLVLGATLCSPWN